MAFGENHYHFDGTNLSTATAVISSNSKMARRMKKLQIGYESAIYDLVKAICYVSTTFGKYNLNILIIPPIYYRMKTPLNHI